MAKPGVTDKAESEDKSSANPFKGRLKASLSPWWDSFRHHSKSLKTLALLLSVVVYYGAVVAVFSYGEANFGVGHSLYFATVMITTVGYGDFLPTTPGLKIATICLVLFGLSVVVLAFGILQDIVVSASTARAVGKASQVGLFETKAYRRQQRNMTMQVTMIYIAFLVMGTIVFGHDLDTHMDSDSEQPYLDGFYLSIITITTVGFGDLSPLSDGATTFSCFYMLLGIPVQLSAFGLVSNFFLNEDEEIELRKVKGLLNEHKYTDMSEFVEEMRAEGIGNYRGQGEGQISRFEFLVFILVQNGVVNNTNIKKVMKNFDKLDGSKTGFIGKEDVVAIGCGSLDMAFCLEGKNASIANTAATALNATAETDLAIDAGTAENSKKLNEFSLGEAQNSLMMAAQTSLAATSEVNDAEI